MLGYEPNVCIQKLKEVGLGPACDGLGISFHCDSITKLDPTYHTMCGQAKVPYFPIPVTACENMKTHEMVYFSPKDFFKDCQAKGPDWGPSFCYCCCSCFANDTLVGLPKGQAPIYSIAAGDTVLSAAVTKADGNLKVTWSDTKVRFSEGTGKGGVQPTMVYIAFGDDQIEDIICSPDQPFLLSDGKYTLGGRLVPGQELVDRDGNPQVIKLVSIGNYTGGVHHISTNVPWEGSPNGHLILAGGVVAGDFDMQLKFPSINDSLKAHDLKNLPEIGTPEYDKVHVKLLKRSDTHFEFVASSDDDAETGGSDKVGGLFKTYRAQSAPLPYDAQAFFTPAQANDILKSGMQIPLSNPIPLTIFNTCAAQLKGFFPEIDFYYDEVNMEPNLYAFEAYGKKIVNVSGGLARVSGLTYEGLLMAMGHGVGSFYGGKPLNAMNYSAVGEADLYAFGLVAKRLWVSTPLMTYIMAAMEQWDKLFALVSPENAKGNPKDPLNNPSLDCRFETIQTAAAGGGLPECAGGDPLPKIWLEEASASSDDEVSLILSLGLMPEGADDPANYALSPEVTITEAKLSHQSDFNVKLTAKLEADTSYTVTIKNLESILGTGVDPDHDSCTFKTPKD